MGATTGLATAGALLLLAASLAKLARPGPAVEALRAVALPGAAWSVRGLAGAEAAAALGMLIAGGRLAAAAVACCYAGFAGFCLRVLLSGERSVGCGCTGRADTPVTGAHLAVTAVFASTSLLAAAWDAGPVWAGRAPVLTAVLAALAAALGWLAISRLPALSAAAAGWGG